MSDELIETLNSTQQQQRRRQKHSSDRDKRFDPVEENDIINPATLINLLNDNDSSVAMLVLQDESDKKLESFKILSKTSATAKTILNDIQNDQDSIRLNTLRATNVLRFLKNIYDNQLTLN
ncbi:ac102 [Hemileuca sp. nucleopolyhedrovirus]|uniref:Ac102 n=1 Tax=Hemileuca sp. nucleopolyhedrovirus TaxID=1367203 RepID=S5N9C0_9ABAC|nr:ac102 [Hemileuca sp. nucleopolyhedrovirus]AGR56842.1 ac102 [Hemileuca sp. nucleopolyhedrovirus]